MGFLSNHSAEARAACYDVVKLAFDVGITNLWLEGDSNNIINSIKGISSPSWLIGNIIEETRDTLEKFENVHVTHVFREANLVVD